MKIFQSSEGQRSRLFQFGFYAILLLGIYLRTYQFLMGRSLWEDEAHLALNFLSRGYIDLLKPLDHLQSAPPLFLWAVKTLALVFGYGPNALRAFPFILSILSLPLFYYILKEICKNRLVALTGFFAFAVNLSLIYFSSELKPYAVDVAFYLLLIYLTISPNPFVGKYRSALLILSGIGSLLCSNIGLIILLSITGYFAVQWYRDKAINRGQVKILLYLAASAILYYFLFVFNNPYRQLLIQDWLFAFPPHPLFSASFSNFMCNSIREIGFDLLLYISRDFGFGYFFAFLLILGVAHAAYRRRIDVLFLACLPVILHFVLAYFKIYPFWYRFILYFVPALILLACYGLSVLVLYIVENRRLAASICLSIFCSVFLAKESFSQFPLWFREIKPILSYINKYYPGKEIYITTPSTLYQYYFSRRVVRNPHKDIEWNISPEKYYSLMCNVNHSYLLLHASDSSVDGYGRVMRDLKKGGLVVKEFEYKTYTVSEIKPMDADTAALYLRSKDFEAGATFNLNGTPVAVIWHDPIKSVPVHLTRGTYSLNILAMGSPLGGIYPHLNLYFDDMLVSDFSVVSTFAPFNTNVYLKEDKDYVLKVTMTNDLQNSSEDRNVFIQAIRLKKLD